MRGLLLRVTSAGARAWSVFYRFNGDEVAMVAVIPY